MTVRAGAGALLAFACALSLTACSPGTDPAPSPTTGGSPTASASPSSDPSPSATPTPTAEPASLPTDCKAILSADVLAQLDGVPLNDPAFGESGVGVGVDGTLRCIWRDPRADTTGLATTIQRMPRGEALDMLNALADDEGFTCFTPDEGTRCEKTWQNEQYPVTDGRTLFWRDDILIDTRYSNLAPSGYTSSIIAHIWSD